MEKKLLDLKDHHNNLFRAARNGFGPVINEILNTGVDPNIIRMTTPAFEARLHGHSKIGDLIDQCKNPSKISRTDTPSDWTMDRWRTLYENKSLYLSCLPQDNEARNAITNYLIGPTFHFYDDVESEIEELARKTNQTIGEYAIQKQQLERSLINGESHPPHQIKHFKDQIRQINEEIDVHDKRFKFQKNQLLQRVLEKALISDVPFIQDVLRDLADNHGIFPQNYFGIQTELLIPRKKRNSRTNQILFFGARMGNVNMVRYALNIGADPEAEEEITPLAETVLHKKDAEVKPLVEKGADINKGTWSALHFAALFANPTTRFLLEHPKADPLKQTPEGETPFSILCKRHVQILREPGPSLIQSMTQYNSQQGYRENNTYQYDKKTNTCFKIPECVRGCLWILYLRNAIPAIITYDQQQILQKVIDKPPEAVDPVIYECLKNNPHQLIAIINLNKHLSEQQLQKAKQVALWRKQFLNLYLLGHNPKDQTALQAVEEPLYRACIAGGETRGLLRMLAEKKEIKKSQLQVALFLAKKYNNADHVRIVEFLLDQQKKESLTTSKP